MNRIRSALLWCCWLEFLRTEQSRVPIKSLTLTGTIDQIICKYRCNRNSIAFLICCSMLFSSLPPRTTHRKSTQSWFSRNKSESEKDHSEKYSKESTIELSRYCNVEHLIKMQCVWRELERNMQIAEVSSSLKHNRTIWAAVEVQSQLNSIGCVLEFHLQMLEYLQSMPWSCFNKMLSANHNTHICQAVFTSKHEIPSETSGHAYSASKTSSHHVVVMVNKLK